MTDSACAVCHSFRGLMSFNERAFQSDCAPVIANAVKHSPGPELPEIASLRSQ